MSTCIFCRIAAGAAPARIVLDTAQVIAFHDIHPSAPTHVLVVPRRHLVSLWELDEPELAGHLLHACAEVARLEKLDRGFRVISNNGHDGGQEVGHLHLHVLGGRRMGPMLSKSV